MSREKLRLLRRIMELKFGVLELNLYLNTHPRDQKALENYNQLVSQLKELKKNYQQRYGALTAESPSDYPWEYIQSPWPWEISY